MTYLSTKIKIAFGFILIVVGFFYNEKQWFINQRELYKSSIRIKKGMCLDAALEMRKIDIANKLTLNEIEILQNTLIKLEKLNQNKAFEFDAHALWDLLEAFGYKVLPPKSVDFNDSKVNLEGESSRQVNSLCIALGYKILGDAYLNTQKGVYNKPKGVHYLEKSIELYKNIPTELCPSKEGVIGQPSAVLAIEYFKDGDTKQAIDYANQAVQNGYEDVWYYLANESAKNKNFACVDRFFEEGLKTKNPQAIFEIARCYLRGWIEKERDFNGDMFTIKIPKNTAKAVEILHNAENLNSPLIFSFLRELYSVSEWGWQVDMEKAVAYAQKASNLGDGDSFFFLGRAYLNGWGGLKRDAKKVIECLLKATEKGNATATYNMGVLYITGHEVGIHKNFNKGLFYLHQASEKGVVGAKLILGRHYAVQENTNQTGIKLLEEAEKEGSVEASNFLGQWYFEKGKFDEAFRHFEHGAKNGDAKSQFYLAEYYFFGLGKVNRDRKKAKQLYMRAYAQGHKGASKRLDGITQN